MRFRQWLRLLTRLVILLEPIIWAVIYAHIAEEVPLVLAILTLRREEDIARFFFLAYRHCWLWCYITLARTLESLE